jgi:hypothetical protein
VSQTPAASSHPVGVLRQLVRHRPPRPAGPVCDLCGEPLDDRHGHLVDLEHRALRCVCTGCRLLFTHEGAGGGRYRPVPDRYRRISGFADAGWDELAIPVGVAFFLHDSRRGQPVALYPSPAGATESELPRDGGDALAGHDPEVATLRPDVEAVLVRRTRDVREAYLVPIDVCYELVGLLRSRWTGFDGGSEARAAIDGFFARIASRCGPSVVDEGGTR